MDLHQLLDIGPLFHERRGQPYSWGLSRAVLEYLGAVLWPGARTLETGSGISTVVFALRQTDHICVSPAEGEILRIKAFCVEHDISLAALRFIIDYSERYLPRLAVPELDLVLIDGAHRFPIPFIDWYYAAERLKVGGLLILDDTQLWPVHVLKRVLMADPGWMIEQDFAPRSVAFRKTGATATNESEQAYVLEETAKLIFRVYPDDADSLRSSLPEFLVRREQRRVAFRLHRLWRAARIALTPTLPGPIKRIFKRVWRARC
jgi:hypothetical protein